MCSRILWFKPFLHICTHTHIHIHMAFKRNRCSSPDIKTNVNHIPQKTVDVYDLFMSQSKLISVGERRARCCTHTTPIWLLPRADEFCSGYKSQDHSVTMGVGSANERRRYYVTPSLIGRAHTHNGSCTPHMALCSVISSVLNGFHDGFAHIPQGCSNVAGTIVWRATHMFV